MKVYIYYHLSFIRAHNNIMNLLCGCIYLGSADLYIPTIISACIDVNSSDISRLNIIWQVCSATVYALKLTSKQYSYVYYRLKSYMCRCVHTHHTHTHAHAHAHTHAHTHTHTHTCKHTLNYICHTAATNFDFSKYGLIRYKQSCIYYICTNCK